MDIKLPDGRNIMDDPTVTTDEVRTALVNEVQREGRITHYAEKLWTCLGVMAMTMVPPLRRATVFDMIMVGPRTKAERSLAGSVRELAFIALVKPLMEPNPTMTVGQAMKQLNWPGWREN